MLPGLKSTLPGEDHIGIDDRFADGRLNKMQFVQETTDTGSNNDTTRLDLQHLNQSTEAQMPLIHSHLEVNENNTNNKSEGDSTSENKEQLQSSSKTNIPHDRGQPSQKATDVCQLPTTDVNPTCENEVSSKLKDSSTLTDFTDNKHCDSSDTKLKKSFSDKGHGQCDIDVPMWAIAASKIRFKALPQTRNRPIQPLADDYVLVMRLLEKGFQNDPNFLKAIGITESRKQPLPQGAGSRRLQACVTIFPAPRKPSMATSTNRAHKPSGSGRRWERSSTQQRQRRRTPKGSANKKSTRDGARCTAYGKQRVCKLETPARNTSDVQKRRAGLSQQTQTSPAVVVQQRSPPEAKRFSPTTANQKKLAAAKVGARCASQVCVPTTQTSKPILTSDLRRVLEASAAQTQNVLKRAVSDCERLSRTSTPSTNNLLKRVASDLKKISRDSMTSFNNVQQEGGKICIPKAPPSQTAKHAKHANSKTCLKNSKLHKTSQECCCQSLSLEIKNHMPDVSSSEEPQRSSVTQLTPAKPCAGKSPFKCNTMEAGKIIPSNPVSTTTVQEANRKPKHKNIKTTPLDGLGPPKYCNNTQFVGNCTLEYPFSKIPLPQTNSKLIKNAEKNISWQGLRPPESCINVVRQNSMCIPTCGLRPPPHETVTAQKGCIHNLWDGLRPLSTTATPMSQPPHLSSTQALTKECVPQPAITNTCNLPQPSKSEGKECVLSTGFSPASDIGKNDKQDTASLETHYTSLVSLVPTLAHSATTKSFSSDSQTSQEFFMSEETLSSRKQSCSSFVSSKISEFCSDSFGSSQVSGVTVKKGDYSTDDETQRLSEKSTPSRLSPVSSSKSVPFFQKVRKIFRIRFCCCKPKLSCLRPSTKVVSTTSLN